MSDNSAEQEAAPEDVRPAVRRVEDEREADREAADLPEGAENVPDEEADEVVEEHLEAREEADAEQAEERLEEAEQREENAAEVANPDNHRDEPPFES